MSQPEPLTEQQLAHWKRRALQAEAAVGLALWMRPLTPGGRRQVTGEPESAEQLCDRLRQNIAATYPHLIVRHEHQKIEVFELADGCGCDPNADDYEDEHSESSDEGDDLCVKRRLGFICDSCENEDGDGPAWKPYAVEWPCPPIAALDPASTETAAPAPSVAPLAASQPSEAAGEGETGERATAGRVGDSGTDTATDPGWCTFGEDDAPGSGCILPAGHQPPNRHIVTPGDTDDDL
ncbi:hypothetical protein STRTUCAR8_08605 [Streptomyces turgidiscabies Car8]|uniref:Uncharacterized protein n=1 Tax=Streptomyces turgidiscabies (strain Car8) TaxID=698760 RepID=L7F948_STRT8|nr:hypothetical protein [Streptomyces turgidiscabies]ELP67629.1 hypothetical protein STRTUCAR8_08605 [Streptomyces turgidiscabies Car8]